jgi:hypothetical protein
MRPLLGDGPAPDRAEDFELALAPDEWRRGERAVGRGRRRFDGQPSLDRVGLSLRPDRRQLLVAHRMARGAVRLGADDHPTRRRGVLQARCGVHDVAGRERLAAARLVDRDDRLAGVDRGPRRKIDRLQHAQSRANGAFRVVAVRDRRAEDRHHRVADELLHHAAVLLDALPRLAVIRLQQLADVLGVRLVGPRCRIDQVDEQDRDELPLLLRGRRLAERGAAVAAEAPSRRIGVATAGATDLDGGHMAKVLPTGPVGSI